MTRILFLMCAALLVSPATAVAQATLLTVDGFTSPWGDAVMPRGDDLASGPVVVTGIAPLASAGVDSLVIHTNGVITTGRVYEGYLTPDASMVPEGVFAPWWGDVDTREPTAGGTNDVYVAVEAHLQRVIISWIDVSYFGGPQEQTNSFQIVLLADADGRLDVEYRYARCAWTLAGSQGGRVGHGDGGAMAVVAMPDGSPAWVLPGSGTPGVASLCEESNVGEPGVWRWSARHDERPTLAGGDPPSPQSVTVHGPDVRSISPRQPGEDVPTAQIGTPDDEQPAMPASPPQAAPAPAHAESSAAHEPSSAQRPASPSPAVVVALVPPATPTLPAPSAPAASASHREPEGRPSPAAMTSPPTRQAFPVTPTGAPFVRLWPAADPIGSSAPDAPGAGAAPSLIEPDMSIEPGPMWAAVRLPFDVEVVVPVETLVPITATPADPSPPVLGVDVDRDGDGVVASEDCDDTDPDIGVADRWYYDDDGDGLGDGDVWIETCDDEPSEFVLRGDDDCPQLADPDNACAAVNGGE